MVELIVLIAVGSEALSLAVFVSPPPETVAVLVTDEAALLATLTVIVMGGYVAPAAKGSVRAQTNVLRVQVQPTPLIAVAVKPAGRASAAETEPEVAMPPAFPTDIRYIAPLWPRLNAPLCVFEIVRSGPEAIGIRLVVAFDNPVELAVRV